MHASARLLATGVGALLLGAPAAQAALPAGATRLLDRPSGDAPLPVDGGGYSIGSAGRGLSADGRYATFESDADALALPNGSTEQRYVYVRDRQARTIENVCVSSQGAIGDRGCNQASISPNGRFVVFNSTSKNLGGGPVPSSNGIYLRDRLLGTTTLMSRRTGGAGTADDGSPTQGSVSDTGVVGFATTTALDPADSGTHSDVYVRAGTTTKLISQNAGVVGNGDSSEPDVSGDGTMVAFSSRATNLSAADGNTRSDIYVATTAGGTPSLKSRAGTAGAVGTGDSEAPSLSQTGSVVAFQTASTNLLSVADTNGATDVVVRDEGANPVNRLASAADGSSAALASGGSWPILSPSGAHVAFSSALPGDAWSAAVLVRTMATQRTVTASRKPGASGDAVDAAPGGVSDSGNLVLFGSAALDGGLTSQQWVRDIAAGANDRVSRPGAEDLPLAAASGVVSDTSADGRFNAISTAAFGFGGTGGQQHLYLRDERSRTVTQIDRAPSGVEATWTEQPVMSADGAVVVFQGAGPGLAPGDEDGKSHLYVWQRATGELTLADRKADGTVVGLSGEGGYDISADSKVVVFTTNVPLDPADNNAKDDVYARTLATGEVRLVSRGDGTAGAILGQDSRYPVINATGTVVAFATRAAADPVVDTSPDTDTYVRDLGAGRTTLVSRADGASGVVGDHQSYPQDISADGTRVLLGSSATNLGDGDADTHSDLHIRDLTTGRTIWVSAPAAGQTNDADSDGGTISADGRTVAFSTGSKHLMAIPQVAAQAIYLRDVDAGTTAAIATPPGVTARSEAFGPRLSANGQCLAFSASMPLLVDGGYTSPDYRHAYLRALGDGCVADDPAGPTPTPAPAAKDTVRPVLSSLKASHKAFATAGKAKGTVLTFSASESVTARLEIAKLSAGKRKGKRCLKPSKVRGRAKACLLEGKPILLRAAKLGAGKRTLIVDGKIGQRRIKPGRYRLILTATDAAGNATAKRLTVDVRVR